jgi:hypothetical protein
MRARVVWLALAACSGSAPHVEIGPPPPRLTHGLLFGPLCEGDHCTCRELSAAGDGGAGIPPAGKKRFELRLGPSSHELWASLPGATLYKSAERSLACFYIDLPSGDTPVELRAEDPSGVSAAWSIHELGAKTQSWYDTFTFNCGSPGACSFDELASEHARLDGYKHHVEDPCGSVKLKGLGWDTGKAPDAIHPDKLVVRATLAVYKRRPTQAHGDASCGKGPPPADTDDGAGSAASSDE